jgi:hypothetical protein
MFTSIYNPLTISNTSKIVIWAKPLSCGRLGRYLAPLGLASVIDRAGHNISPRLRKQLVLELEVGVLSSELRQVLPCRLLPWQPLPLNKDVPLAAPLLSPERDSRCGKEPAVPYRR